MPHSYNDLRPNIKGYLEKMIWPRSTEFLDVGAGAGIYADTLRKTFPNIDAVEVWEPYIEEFGLRKKYRDVICADVQELATVYFANRVIIMGDVFEHLTVEDAQALLTRMQQAGARTIVIVVPYMYEQGPDHPDVVALGNKYEIHHQPDLTHDVFMQRYPSMELLTKNDRVGAYIWERKFLVTKEASDGGNEGSSN